MKHPGWFAAAVLLSAAPASAQNWADIPTDSDFSASKELCRKVRGVKLPDADRPDAATRKALKGCSSEALYYGIGMPADPIRARQCAFLEMEADGSHEGSAGVFSGRVMLMTIYANGVGAERNLDIAIDLACHVPGAPYEYDGRVMNLAELKAKGWTGKNFSYCDNITSGMAQGLCAEHGARLAKQERARKLGKRMEKWSAADRQAFTPLQKALDTFVEALGSNEVDLSGTAGGAMMVDDQESHRADFEALLEQLEQGKGPRASAEDFKAEDARLNKVYQAVQKYPDEDVAWGTVTKAGIKKTQKAWLKYRDAWVAFARIHYPSVTREALSYELTKQRIARLEGFLMP
jgi:uncharacterized protein YecT (DUF1311 family)